MEQAVCPRCNRASLDPGNRLITEKCGHIKCRECFINDLDGCHECIHGPSQRIPDRQALVHCQNDQIMPTMDIPINLEIVDSRGLSGDPKFPDLSSVHETTIPEQAEASPVILPVIASSINVIRNYHTPDNEEILNEATESLKILEEYIMPPKSKIEKFFRETKTTTVAHERKKTIPDHVVKIEENGEIYYKCNVCEKKFNSRSQQYYHAHCANGGSKRYKCKTCAKDFFSSSHLNYHVKSHHETNKYTCNICSKTFKHSMNLRRHKRTHEGTYKYKCKECGLGFRETKTFTAHINKHRNIFPFVCKVCGKKFSFKSNLTQHQKIHSGLGKHFRCDDCGREFLRKNSYMEHMNRHNKVKSFQCKLCQTLFIDRKTLERHMNTHGSKYYKCPNCDVKCGRKDNLVRHIRNMHPNEDMTEIMNNVKTVILTNKVNLKCNRNKIPQSTLVEKSTLVGSTEEQKIVDNQKNSYETHAQASINTSVIRSIGNVKPVHIPTNCELENNLIQIKSIEPKPQIPATIDSTANQATISTLAQTSHGSNEVKKPKKKYDPCEIYRKILAGNDVDDSVLESEELYSDSRDDHVGCCDPVNDLIPITPLVVATPQQVIIEERRINENTEPLNFGEIHWRKRTSQNFYTSL